jgi:hypothetical protein
MVLDGLPERYVLKYDVLFVRRLVTTAVCMTARLTQPHFGQLSCVAEELLMRLLLIQAEVIADLYGLLDDEVRQALEFFADGVYEDMDHEWLYDPSADGIDEDPAFAHMGIAPQGHQRLVQALQRRALRPRLRGGRRQRPQRRASGGGVRAQPPYGTAMARPAVLGIRGRSGHPRTGLQCRFEGA